MKKILAAWLLSFMSLWVVSSFLGGMYFASTKAMIGTSLAIVVMNKFLKPVLNVLAFPLTFMTLGLFSFVVNGMVLMAAFSISEGSYISSLLTAIVASIALGFVNHMLEDILK